MSVSVTDGVVTLQGIVPTAREKWLCERAARHPFGVRAVANDLEVVPSDSLERTDPSIAQAAVNALERDTSLPPHRVKVTVRHGWVTLTGTVTWRFQKAAAERSVQRIPGVKGVANSIAIEPQVSLGDLKSRIEEALRRSAEADARGINIEAHDGTVVLSGTVHSLIEKDAAEKAVWAAPGVVQVDDRLRVVS